ncbi:hypothetical protein BCM20_005801 [Clostridium beijerinckii]|nr:hypothetical protein [Clostridium beijerinckii]NYC05704.1 hypothetical protein [Clostridium beijerinckii]
MIYNIAPLIDGGSTGIIEDLIYRYYQETRKENK